MATTTMRLGLLLIVALAIIQISKAELEKEDESQIEQKPEENMMASSMEEVELRNVREAGNQNRRPGKNNKKRKDKNAKKKKRQNKKKGRRNGRKKKGSKKTRKNRPNKKGGKKKGSKKTRKNRPNKKGGKKKKKSGSKKRRVQKKKEKELKKKKRTKKIGKKTRGGVVVRQTCDEVKLCQKIKDYIKYSNQLRKVKRIVKSCETMEKKANKSATEFDATVAALDTVIASNAKRRLYIRWRRTQRSTDEVVAIRDNLKNCSVSAKAKCERKVEPACGETALHTECEAALQDWVNKFGPSKGSCLQANADCCACITALVEVDAKCLDFDTKSNNAVKSKKKCTGTDTGSFGFCRKQQQEASVKGPPAACGGSSSGTKAPSSGTTAAATTAGATTAKPQAPTTPLTTTSLPTTSTTSLRPTSTTPLPTTSTISTSPLSTTTMVNLTLNVSSLEESVASLVVLMDNLTINVDAINTKVDTNTAKADANAVTIAAKCDSSTCIALQAAVAKQKTCLGDVSSSDCPSPASGKIGVVGIIANTANIANKCEASTCTAIETKATNANSCVADTSSTSCPIPTSGKTSITGAITNLETPTVFSCYNTQGVTASGTMAPYGACQPNVGTVVDTTSGKFTVAKAGKYRLTFMSLMYPLDKKKVIAIMTKTSGGVETNLARSLAQSKIGIEQEQITTTLDIIVHLAVADTVHVAIVISGTASIPASTAEPFQTYFTGKFISA